MLFNSYIFIFAFFPSCLIGYFILRKFHYYQLSKLFLSIMSLIFYAYFKLSYLYIIVSSILVNFFISKIMQRFQKRRIILIVALLFNIGILFYYKYFNFTISNLNIIFHLQLHSKNILLPLGISFFTFQQLSFVIDQYQNPSLKYKFLDYFLFVTYFPQLIAGPIVMHDEMIPQFNDSQKSRLQFENINRGLFLFTLGMLKKVFCADTLGLFVDAAYGQISSGLNPFIMMIAVFSYTLQIYFDFSGYCDMAIGIGAMFNIDIPLNFDSPYHAKSISEFWKRWHKTLTRFLTTYLYIPLGGSRNGKVRTYINIIIVFVVSGIWHGANYTFILWGILNGLLMSINRLMDYLKLKIYEPISKIITFLLLNCLWIFFRATSITQIIHIFKTLFRFHEYNYSAYWDFIIFKDIVNSKLLEFETILNGLGIYKIDFAILYIVFLVVMIVICMFMKNSYELYQKFKPSIWLAILNGFLLFYAVASIAGVSQFLYFNF